MKDLSLIAMGLVALVAGSELILRGATRLALSLGVKPLVLGITIVAVGTSAPELAVGITAGAQGSGAMAVGNIAGTNVFNVMFILALSAALKPLPLHSQILRLELPMILVSSFLMIILSWDGVLSQLDGIFMFLVGVGYTITLIRVSRKETKETVQNYEEAFDVRAIVRWRRLTKTRPGYFILMTVGIALSVVGASFLVEGSSQLARSLGVTETMIGLTVIAIGTSAPELVTTILSTIKGDRDVAVGNLLGSSIYNILIILGLSCIFTPSGFPVEGELLLIDIPFMVAVALSLVPVFVSGREITRLEGILGVLCYTSYMSWLVFFRS